MKFPGNYPIQLVISELYDIENRPMWDLTVKDAKMIKKYSKNLSARYYVCELVPGCPHQFYEKCVAFQVNDIGYLYSSSLANTPSITPGIKTGTTIIGVAKICRTEKGDVSITLVRQQKIALKGEREEYVYSRGYLAFKNAFQKRLHGLN